MTLCSRRLPRPRNKLGFIQWFCKLPRRLLRGNSRSGRRRGKWISHSGWKYLLRRLLGWEPSELFGFYYDTRPWYGDLEPLRACFGREDACRAVRIGAGNIYHACAHNRLHAQDETVVRDLYKSAFFTLRAVHFCRTGMFIRTKRELLPLLKGAEHGILSAALQEPAGSFAEQSERLLDWAGGLLRTFVL